MALPITKVGYLEGYSKCPKLAEAVLNGFLKKGYSWDYVKNNIDYLMRNWREIFSDRELIKFGWKHENDIVDYFQRLGLTSNLNEYEEQWEQVDKLLEENKISSDEAERRKGQVYFKNLSIDMIDSVLGEIYRYIDYRQAESAYFS